VEAFKLRVVRMLAHREPRTRCTRFAWLLLGLLAATAEAQSDVRVEEIRGVRTDVVGLILADGAVESQDVSLATLSWPRSGGGRDTWVIVELDAALVAELWPEEQPQLELFVYALTPTKAERPAAPPPR